MFAAAAFAIDPVAAFAVAAIAVAAIQFQHIQEPDQRTLSVGLSKASQTHCNSRTQQVGFVD